MKRYALILALVMALAAGFGCAKKTTGEPGYDDGLTPEMRAAIQQITDARVYFAFDKFNIQPEYKDMLKTKAELMKKYPSIRVRIEATATTAVPRNTTWPSANAAPALPMNTWSPWA